jgi:hypothetical protein
LEKRVCSTITRTKNCLFTTIKKYTVTRSGKSSTKVAHTLSMLLYGIMRYNNENRNLFILVFQFTRVLRVLNGQLTDLDLFKTNFRA